VKVGGPHASAVKPEIVVMNDERTCKRGVAKSWKTPGQPVLDVKIANAPTFDRELLKTSSKFGEKSGLDKGILSRRYRQFPSSICIETS
jgi:hypothetical protein